MWSRAINYHKKINFTGVKFKTINSNDSVCIVDVLDKLRVVHKGRPQQREDGVCQMRTLLLIVACERPKYADTGGRGVKNGQILRTSLMDGLFN